MNLVLLHSAFERELPLVTFEGFESLDSTNTYLKSVVKNVHKHNLKPQFCITNLQTNGYGQKARSWVSDSHSLTFSLLCKVPVGLNELSGLSLVVALGIVDVLSKFFKQVLYIKWPNDLYSEHGKLGGILIETVAYSPSSCWVVIGVGLNFSNSHALSVVNQSAPIDFLSVDGVEFQQENLVVVLIRKLIALCDNYSVNTFELLHDIYKRYDYFRLNQPVIVYDNERFFKGIYKGLSPAGEVMILCEDKVVNYHSGRVSIRPLD
jgi:BirA family biotin operon repressor/biotin-[acetyl-CoA-carboxylase] ligase